jgi:hypothetical protein
MWQSSDLWERHKQIKIAGMEALQEDLIRGCFLALSSDSLSSCELSKNVRIKIYETLILPVVLYGCEAWFLTLMEEHRLRVFANRMKSRISGHAREWLSFSRRNPLREAR